MGRQEIPARSGSAISDQRHYQGMTYQLEQRRCNRAACKCMIGAIGESGHGPYWYVYWKESGKIRSRYNRVTWLHHFLLSPFLILKTP